MPKKGEKNMALYEKKQVGESSNYGVKPVPVYNKTVRSRLNASEKYDKNNVDNIRLRVPKGWNDRMKQHVAEQKLTDGTPKYNSVNDMLVQLIRKEIGIDG